MRHPLAFVVAFLWLANSSIATAQPLIAVETVHDAEASSVVAHSFGAQTSSRTLGRIAHRADVAPMATVSHDGRSVALLNVSAQGEPRRHADLLLFDLATSQTRFLQGALQQVPVAFSLEDREAFVVRSEALPPPSEEETRHGRLEDERLTLLAVDLQTGRTREVMRDVAYMIHPVGVAHSSELIAIRAAWGGGSLVAIDTTSGRTRVLARTGNDAFRDASLSADGLSVVCVRRTQQGNDVLRVRIEDSAVEVIASQASTDVAPLAFGASGALVTDEHSQVRMMDTGSVFTLWSERNTRWLHAVAVSPDLSLIVLESISSEARETLVLQTRTGAASPLRVNRNAVVHVAGFSREMP